MLIFFICLIETGSSPCQIKKNVIACHVDFIVLMNLSIGFQQ